MNSYTNTGTQAFTITHAKKIASKVATDLKRIQRFYGHPSDERIQKYEEELAEYLNNGYLEMVTYGFQKEGNWIEPTVRYTAKDFAGMIATDDDPGRIPLSAKTEGATFCSFLEQNQDWTKLSTEEQDKFKKNLPFQRGEGNEPGVLGYLSNDKTYSSGGRGVERSIVKNY
jgi:hypothetical protein